VIKRNLQSEIKAQLNKFPVVAITGPRQSGKTTLARSLLPNYAYYNLEDINTRKLANEDPLAFLNSIKGAAIIDEIQKVPHLMSQIQVLVDESKKMGQFVITGSESLLLSEKISQSLAGRVVNNILLPLSYSELKQAKAHFKNLNTQLLNGFYPRIYDTNLTFADFYPEYVNTYVEKDVRQLKNIGDLALFEKFLQLLAGRVGQLVNLTSLSNDVGVSHNTIENWISLLEASYIAYRLKPYYRNIGKRVIKSPKIYFYDTGLLCYLLGVASENVLMNHYAYGSIFENFVINEVSKYIFNNKLRSRLYFYRDSNGVEVDLLIDSGTKTLGIEIKASETFSKEFLKGLKALKGTADIDFRGYLLSKGVSKQSLGDFEITNYHHLSEIFNDIT
jgi:uncharacterized protein